MRLVDSCHVTVLGNDVIRGRAPSAGRQSVRWSPDQCAYANVTSRPRYVGDTVASVLCAMVDTRCSLMYSSSLGYTTAASISFISPSGTLIGTHALLHSLSCGSVLGTCALKNSVVLQLKFAQSAIDLCKPIKVELMII